MNQTYYHFEEFCPSTFGWEIFAAKDFATCVPERPWVDPGFSIPSWGLHQPEFVTHNDELGVKVGN